MFRNHPKDISSLVQQFLRNNSLETPMQQQRLVDSWEKVAGEVAARYTIEKRLKNQTLWIRLNSPALRSDLQMQRTSLINRLNHIAGAQIITDIRFC